MDRWAESYPTDYSAQVERAIGFVGASHDFFIRGKADWLRRFLADKRIAPNDTLDVGCGIGLLHRYLLGTGTKIIGTDVSSDALAEAKKRNPTADYHVYDGKILPFSSGSFDLVLAVTVMHHVPPDQWQEFVAEAARVLRPGGVFIVIEHNPLNPLTLYSVRKSELDFDALRARTVGKLMAQAGLKRCSRDYIFFTPFATTQPIDRALRWFPLGAQYSAYGFK
jgi:SAM-dependent methyltransferase